MAIKVSLSLHFTSGGSDVRTRTLRLSKKIQVCHVPTPQTIPDPSSIEDRTALANACNRKNCLTCPIFKPDPIFRSSVTGKTYKVIGPGDWSCSTSNVVYLVTCQCCGLQYVGETSQALRKRMNNHRANIKSLAKASIFILTFHI